MTLVALASRRWSEEPFRRGEYDRENHLRSQFNSRCTANLPLDQTCCREGSEQEGGLCRYQAWRVHNVRHLVGSICRARLRTLNRTKGTTGRAVPRELRFNGKEKGQQTQSHRQRQAPDFSSGKRLSHKAQSITPSLIGRSTRTNVRLDLSIMFSGI